MDFLEEIRNRGGGGLMSITDPANQRKRSSAQRPLPPPEDGDLLGVLSVGFDKIKKLKNMSSDEEDSDDSDESTDDWSDEDC